MKFQLAYILLMLTVVHAEGNSVPSLINYQGRLSDAEGKSVTGQRDITFSFYNYPATGTPVWTETQIVQVQNGRFNVLLGSVNPVTAAVFSSPEVYLGVKVGTDAEMAPRRRMASVGYAFKAADAETVNGLRANEISGESTAIRKSKYFTGTNCQLVANIPDGSVLTIDEYSYVGSSYSMGVARFYNTTDCTSTPLGLLHSSVVYWRFQVNAGFGSHHPPLTKGFAYHGPTSLYIKLTLGELALGYSLR